jgi:UDP-N-acetylmuramate dehydrogenase
MQQLLAQDARRYSTFRLAATLSNVIEISSVAELQAYHPNQPPLVLGEGSNCVFLTDWQTDILRFVGKDIVKDLREDRLLLHVAAGCNWHQLVEMTVAEGWWGLENLALIPGSVGAAPVQNIGAYGVEMADCCSYVDFYHWDTRSIERFNRQECAFGYRDSIFKTTLAGKGVIVAVGFELTKNGVAQLSYRGIDHLPRDASLVEVMRAVIAVRKSKLPDPQLVANCGSFFKNPVLELEQFQNLVQKYPAIPNYSQPNQQVKVPAAWLIEHVGLKGYQIGDIGCYSLQPLVLVNHGSGTSAQLLELISLIQKSVQQKFAIHLEPEVRLLGQYD